MISTGDFKRGGRVLLDGEPYTIEEFTVQTPSARGAATLVRCKLRGVLNGTLVDRTFKGGDKFEVPDVGFRQVQYLYGDGDSSHFMDVASYEQFALPNERLGDMVPWLTEGLQLSSVVWDGNVVGVDLPQYVEAQVDMVGGGSRSDTASGKNLKEATLTNGQRIRVPLFVESGERILVNPRTQEFVRRA